MANLRSLRIAFWFFVVCCISITTAQADEMLKKEDVHRVMSQILKAHGDNKGINRKIMQSALNLYIAQFDPDKMYLLDDEVEKYRNLTGSQLDVILSEYKNNNFRRFEEVNALIGSAIRRAKGLRHELLTSTDWTHSGKSLSEIAALAQEERKKYAKTEQDLKRKMETEMLVMIRERQGNNRVALQLGKVLNAINAQYEYQENQYLSLAKNNRPLPEQERQNLFYMHVLKALASALDAHTNVLNADESFNMKVVLEKGFQGVGIMLRSDPDGVAIGDLMEGGPAKKSGMVHVGDRILAVNNQNVEGHSAREIIERLRDTQNSTVQLTLSRQEAQGKEKTFSVNLQREFIEIKEGRVDVRKEEIPGGLIGVLKLDAFYQGENGVTSEKDMRDAIQKLKQEGTLKGIILDLRSNGGGFLSQAVKVAGLFITNGVVVISKYTNGEEHFFRDMDGRTSFDGPLIILVSKRTASAAEIVAQALQDYGVALIVGDERTYGKGTVQSQTVTDGSSAAHFKVTVGKYYTVSGKTPQVQGVHAGIVVPSPLNAEHIGEEYLQNHLTADEIASSYQDALTDIQPNLHQWYLRYYMPTLQKKEYYWESLLPGLKTASEGRIAHNTGYQQWLEHARTRQDVHRIPEGKDYQLEETINIMKDVIYRRH